MGFIEVNRVLIFPKLHYFLYFAGMASFWPSITVFAKQLGVSEVAIGILFSVAPVTGLISMPLFGAIADRFKAKKKLFLFFNIINFFALMAFAFLPHKPPTRPVVLECNLGVTYIVQAGSLTVGSNSKCNQTDVQAFKKPNLIETCQVNCAMNFNETVNMCDNLLADNKPQYCSELDNYQDDQVIHTSMTSRLKIHEAQAILDTLYLPVDTIDGLGYSCAAKTGFHNCKIDCQEDTHLNLRLEKLVPIDDIYSSNVFWSYVVLVLISWIAFAVVTSVADALCFQSLGDKPHLYGGQRQWGAIGWGLFSLFSGYLIDVQSSGSIMKDYTPAFYLVFIMLVLNFIVCFKWNVAEEEKPHGLGKSIADLLLNPRIAIFIMACIVVGFCTGLLWQFLFWYVEDIASCDDMQWIKVLQGLISVVQCFGGELPFFYVSSWFIKTLGHVHCMTLVLVAFGIRFLIYSLISNPWSILPVELFQGVTYGIFYSNMASYAYVVSPPGSAATVQGIVGAAFEGIGVGAGSLLGGILYKSLSGKSAFMIFGCFTLVFGIVHATSMHFINRRFKPISQDDTFLSEGLSTSHSEMRDMDGKKFMIEGYEDSQ